MLKFRVAEMLKGKAGRGSGGGGPLAGISAFQLLPLSAWAGLAKWGGFGRMRGRGP